MSWRKTPIWGALFRLLLEGDGHEVVLTRTPDEAVATLQDGGVGLILVEPPAYTREPQSLAGWRGVLRDVSQEVPVILCSAAASISRIRSVVAGFEGFIEMPFDVEVALAEVRRVLGAHSPCTGASAR